MDNRIPHDPGLLEELKHIEPSDEPMVTPQKVKTDLPMFPNGVPLHGVFRRNPKPRVIVLPTPTRNPLPTTPHPEFKRLVKYTALRRHAWIEVELDGVSFIIRKPINVLNNLPQSP